MLHVIVEDLFCSFNVCYYSYLLPLSILLLLCHLSHLVASLIHGGYRYRLDSRQQHNVPRHGSHGRPTRPQSSRTTVKPNKNYRPTTLRGNHAIDGKNDAVHITRQNNRGQIIPPIHQQSPARRPGTTNNSNLSATDVSAAFLWLPLLVIVLFSILMISLMLLTRRGDRDTDTRHLEGTRTQIHKIMI